MHYRRRPQTGGGFDINGDTRNSGMSNSEAAPLLHNATRDLAAFAANLKFSDIPAEAIERIKYCALDSIGCCIFGVTLPWTRHVQAMVNDEGAKQVASI